MLSCRVLNILYFEKKGFKKKLKLKLKNGKAISWHQLKHGKVEIFYSQSLPDCISLLFRVPICVN